MSNARICRLSVILSCGLLAGAQTPPPPTVARPSEAEQRDMLAKIEAYVGATYKQTSPPISCVQPILPNTDSVRGSARARSAVTVDYQPPAKRRAQNGLNAAVDVNGLMRELLFSDKQIAFDRWATVRGLRLALFHYGQRGLLSQDADIYAEASSGRVWRIVFRGFETPAHFANYYCWSEGN